VIWHRWLLGLLLALGGAIAAVDPSEAMAAPARLAAAPPTLDDFWSGRASWQLDAADVGLPVGESDTVLGSDGALWSYLHASARSAGVTDQFGAPVPFPGCVTRWLSGDGGRHFGLLQPVCIIPCTVKPCSSTADQVDQQQYPRVARSASGGWAMVYEWRGANYLRTSSDGLSWSRPAHIANTRQWRLWYAACGPGQAIGAHPFVNASTEYQCSAGGPPGLAIDGETLYVFIPEGKSPGAMGCYSGPLAQGAAGLRRCQHGVLFSGSPTYGPADARGAAANPYFDFRMVSSADVLKAGQHYYMAYEGDRGPDALGGGDDQFGLGFARSAGPAIDGPWEKYPRNPVLTSLPGNIGVGHADLIVINGVTYLYSATTATTRGRYVLAWS